MVMATASLQKGTLIARQSAPRVWEFQSAQNAVRAGYFLEEFEPISLSEMGTVALLKRVDTKYVLHIEQLFQALSGLQDQYRVLQVGGSRLNRYHNLHFNTPEFKLYHQHHNERSSRYKVRSRDYVDSKISFLEIKHKNNYGQTIRSRMQTGEFVSNISGKERTFLITPAVYTRIVK